MPAFGSLSGRPGQGRGPLSAQLAGSKRSGRGFRRSQDMARPLLWQGRMFAVPHGEGRGRLHRLGSFQLRQHAVGRRHSRCDYRSQPELSILESAPVAVTTADGQTLTGVVRNEDNFSLQLQTTDGTLHLFAKSELQKHRISTAFPDARRLRIPAQPLRNWMIS